MRFESPSHAAPSRTHDFALRQRHRRTSPRRQENQIPVQLARAPIVPSGDNAPPPRPSPRETAGEPSVLRRKIVAFPAGVRPLRPSEKISVSPSDDNPLATDATSHPRSRSVASPGGLTGHADPNGVSGQQDPAVGGDVVQHEPVGRAVHGALDPRERDGMQLRSRRLLAWARGREPDLASRWRPGQSNACQAPREG